MVRWLIRSSLLGPSALVVVLAAWVALTPLPAALHRPGGAVVLDGDGEVLRATLHEGVRSAGTGTGTRWSPHLVAATLAGEDHRFHHHLGLDPVGLVRSLWLNLRHGEVRAGGSTITQQLARLTFPGPRTLGQKLKEAFWALVLERHLSKPDILDLYLERAPYGGTLTGAEAASQDLFGCSAAQLSLAQASLLATVPRAPARYALRSQLSAALRRRDRLLARMVDLGFISHSQQADALAEPVELLPPPRPEVAVQAAVAALRDSPDQGAGEIRTWLRPRLQARAQELVRATVRDLRPRGVEQAAALVVGVRTGRVLAYVGSADPDDHAHAGQVDGVRAMRSPGSALKPLIYAAALEQGLSPATLLWDEPQAFTAGPDGRGRYLPRNFDLVSRGPLLLRLALGASLNQAAVDLAQRMGPAVMVSALHGLGLSLGGRTADELGLGLVLGGSEASLWQLAQAYLALASGGVWRPLQLTAAGAAGQQEPRRVWSAQTAFVVADMLADDRAREATFGRGSVLALPFHASVKTGTSKDFRDNWAVGFSPTHLVATWAGDFRGTPMRGVSGITGAGTLWHKLMRSVHLDADPSPPPPPMGVTRVQLCRHSGRLAGPDCAAPVAEWLRAADPMPPRCQPPVDHAPAHARADQPVRIITPRPEDVFRLDRSRPREGHGLKLTAAGPPGVRLQLWVDGARLAEGRGQVDAVWTAGVGRHEVEARGEHGSRASVRFRVE